MGFKRTLFSTWMPVSEHEHDISKRHHKKTAHKRRFFVWSSIISKFLSENFGDYADLKRKIRVFLKFIVSKYQKYKLYIDILIFKVYSCRILKL